MKVYFSLVLICFLLTSFFVSCSSNQTSRSPLIFEIDTKDGIKQVVVQPDEIVKVGIDERIPEPQIGITIAQKHHTMIEKLTRENIGQKMVIRTDTETIFSGIIREPILGAELAFTRPSVQEAENTIKKMRREPDYRLKLTPKELEAGKRSIEPYKSQWANKAIEASANRDHTKAVEYAKKAIEEDPHEARYHKLLSLAYYQGGKTKLALDEALTAEKLSSKEDLKRSPGTYLDIAYLYSQLNEYEKAIEYLKKVLSIKENNTLARLDLAEIYEKIGKYDLAIQEYRVLSQSGDEKVREKGLQGMKRLEGREK